MAEARNYGYLRRKASIFRARAATAGDTWAARRLNELAEAFEAEAAKDAALVQSAANDVVPRAALARRANRG